MVFIHRIAEYFAETRSAAAIRHELRRLAPRALADLGVTQEDLPYVARLGARLGPKGVSMTEIVREAREWRLREPTMRSRMANVAQGIVAAIEGTDLGRRLNLELVWRRAYRRVRAELETYSDQELMADLRLNRSDIDGIAAEGAHEQVAGFVAAHPAYRRVGHGWASFRRVAG